MTQRLLWGAALFCYIASGVTIGQVIQQEHGAIPHADSLVPLLWTFVGALVLVIGIMLRLWYRDFVAWKEEMRRDLKQAMEELAEEKGWRKAVDEKLDGIKSQCDARYRIPQPTKHKGG